MLVFPSFKTTHAGVQKILFCLKAKLFMKAKQIAQSVILLQESLNTALVAMASLMITWTHLIFSRTSPYTAHKRIVQGQLLLEKKRKKLTGNLPFLGVSRHTSH